MKPACRASRRTFCRSRSPQATSSRAPDDAQDCGRIAGWIADRRTWQTVGCTFVDAEQLAAVEIARMGGQPFFSPDGKWLGFWQEGQLKRVSVTGGAPVSVWRGAIRWGASWASDDAILYGQGPGGIWRVPAAGGTPSTSSSWRRGSARRARSFCRVDAPCCFRSRKIGEGWDDAQIVVQSLDADGVRKVVVQGGTDARYLPTGHLVYARARSLLALPFDIGKLEVDRRGDVPSSMTWRRRPPVLTGAAHFSVSTDGTLVYVPTSSLGCNSTSLRLGRPDGRRDASAGAPGVYLAPTLSPDGVAGRVHSDHR